MPTRLLTPQVLPSALRKAEFHVPRKSSSTPTIMSVVQYANKHSKGRSGRVCLSSCILYVDMATADRNIFKQVPLDEAFVQLNAELLSDLDGYTLALPDDCRHTKEWNEAWGILLDMINDPPMEGTVVIPAPSPPTPPPVNAESEVQHEESAHCADVGSQVQPNDLEAM